MSPTRDKTGARTGSVAAVATVAMQARCQNICFSLLREQYTEFNAHISEGVLARLSNVSYRYRLTRAKPKVEELQKKGQIAIYIAGGRVQAPRTIAPPTPVEVRGATQSEISASIVG